MPAKKNEPDERASTDDPILYSKTSDDEAASGPATFGSNADEDLQGNDSPVEQAREAAYPQDNKPPRDD